MRAFVLALIPLIAGIAWELVVIIRKAVARHATKAAAASPARDLP